MASASALKALAEALVAEQERRRTAQQRVGDDSRERLLTRLEQIRENFDRTNHILERLTGVGYITLTPAEEKRMIAELEAKFRAAGYDISG